LRRENEGAADHRRLEHHVPERVAVHIQDQVQAPIRTAALLRPEDQRACALCGGTVWPTYSRRAGSRERERCEHHPGQEPELPSMHLSLLLRPRSASPRVSAHLSSRGALRERRLGKAQPVSAHNEVESVDSAKRARKHRRRTEECAFDTEVSSCVDAECETWTHCFEHSRALRGEERDFLIASFALAIGAQRRARASCGTSWCFSSARSAQIRETTRRVASMNVCSHGASASSRVHARPMMRGGSPGSNGRPAHEPVMS